MLHQRGNVLETAPPTLNHFSVQLKVFFDNSGSASFALSLVHLKR